MKAIKLSGILITGILLFGCAPLRVATTVNNGNIKDYEYVFVSPTETLTSSTGSTSTHTGEYSTTTRSVNPKDIIVGMLSKEGFMVLPELRPDLADETLIVNYGESGGRQRVLDRTIEVTIQFISAKSYTLVCSTTAEGSRGRAEADIIRQAITRSLSAVLSEMP